MNIMEIVIDSKRNNPLLNRAEVHFTIQHEGEGTPNREIIRSELAEKLNVKKENVIIDNIHSSFGIQKSAGYAKIYNSVKKTEDWERKHILKRNQVLGKKDEKEREKKPEGKPETVEEPSKETEKPSEESSQKEEQPVESEKKVEKPVEKKG